MSRNGSGRGGTLCAIEPDTTIPSADTDEATRRRVEQRLFSDDRGFFRSPKQDAAYVDPLAGFRVEAGPQWSDDEANAQLRRFLDALAEGRGEIDRADALEYAEANNLLLLIGPREESALLRMCSRMPPAMAARWTRALSGDHDSLEFGRDVGEEDEEAVVDHDVKVGRRRMVGIIVSIAVIAVVLVVIVTVARPDEKSPPVGRIFFGTTQDKPTPIVNVAPVVNPDLTTLLDRPVVIRAGAGAVDSRVELNFDNAILPNPPSTVTATVFLYGGHGQVVFVGPAGFLDHACLQVSAVTLNLRPFDTAVYAAPGTTCPEGIVGRDAAIGCLGDTAIMLDLEFPTGQVDLEEGGTATIGGVRVGSFAARPGYETVSVRGSITVAAGKAEQVPTFGGQHGEPVSFNVTPNGAAAPVIGKCALK